ncbi:16S rRNA (uracil(1498)-N(3))-methyltransferase [Hahella sp. CCB-MM4]|uniref:16S rRNA (uracil(1498)-N(3))-methyltransferase n=1 Tax=Hahella sp. (strain CCB-MM4) TaxID=1926491 RepID=UPI000B9B1841|nr:16S rRNA (uracil(1498)-N(3))-methyltransferase [Hahella sp. CCB-MM4]OZG74901.1 16S rRNA (uracil(1498)-N(3))-methyltransferase [Hahella sp. CCB-MM4]
MNFLLFAAEELSADGILHLPSDDRRSRHITSVLKLQPKDSLKVGQLGGKMGSAEVLKHTSAGYDLAVTLTAPPPPELDLTLILALPRPKMMRRVIENIAALGVKHLILLNAYKVEKSYWQTPWLEAETLRHHCLLGLEQSGDTIVPRIEQKKRFKPFVEDELPGIIQGHSAWVAHPGSEKGIPETPASMVLAIGPEGGFTPYEVGKLQEAGCQSFSLGSRILRVETVVPALLGRLYL